MGFGFFLFGGGVEEKKEAEQACITIDRGFMTFTKNTSTE